MASKEMVTASASAQGTPKNTLDHIRISPAKNGGHTVEHHYKNSGMNAYKSPDIYAFGSGPETMAHLNDHLGVKENKKVAKMKGAGYTSSPGGKADDEMAEKEPTVKQGNRRTRAEQRGHS